jgi:hypothetical protein
MRYWSASLPKKLLLALSFKLARASLGTVYERQQVVREYIAYRLKLVVHAITQPLLTLASAKDHWYPCKNVKSH